MELKLPPPFKSVATLLCENGQHLQFYSTVNSDHSDEKRLIAVNFREECYLSVFLHRLIYSMCLKCPPSAHMRV